MNTYQVILVMCICACALVAAMRVVWWKLFRPNDHFGLDIASLFIMVIAILGSFLSASIGFQLWHLIVLGGIFWMSLFIERKAWEIRAVLELKKLEEMRDDFLKREL